jgi:hypothetical protein
MQGIDFEQIHLDFSLEQSDQRNADVKAVKAHSAMPLAVFTKANPDKWISNQPELVCESTLILLASTCSSLAGSRFFSEIAEIQPQTDHGDGR